MAAHANRTAVLHISSDSLPELLGGKPLSFSRAAWLLVLYSRASWAADLLLALQVGVANELAKFPSGPMGAIKPTKPRGDTRLAAPLPSAPTLLNLYTDYHSIRRYIVSRVTFPTLVAHGITLAFVDDPNEVLLLKGIFCCIYY